MNKTISVLTITALMLLLSAGRIFASPGDLSVKISQPKSPTNQNTFNVNFVALDIANRPVVVKCFKKGPFDAGYSQFGSDFNLDAGGNSDNCLVSGSQVNNQGTYSFKVTATAGSDTVESSIVTVDYNTSGPGTPSDYRKEQVNNCTFKLKFKTANDGGKTVKVEFYRSDQTSFVADSGTVFASLAIGSNTEGEVSNTVPDCSKTYYFALRAFDSSGNGSGLVGDSFTTTTTSTTINSTQTQVVNQPIVVDQPLAEGADAIAESSSDSETDSSAGEVITADSPTPQVEGVSTDVWWAKPIWKFAVLALALILVGYVIKKKFPH